MMMILLILMLLIFGFLVLNQREFKITRYRKVDGETCRMLGHVILFGAGLLLILGGWVGWVSLMVAIIVGLMSSQPIIE